MTLCSYFLDSIVGNMNIFRGDNFCQISGCNFSFQCNKLKKKFLFKQERDSYSSFNRASFVTFVTAKVTI